MREISPEGKAMLAFQEKQAELHKYKPIPIDMFVGDIRGKYKEALPKWCKEVIPKETSLYSAAGTQLCKGFERIVIGDYGAFIEINPRQMCEGNLKIKEGEEYRYMDERYAKNVKYLWLTSKDDSDCKIYSQKKTVEYADYRPGMYYISPYEVFLTEK